MKSSFEIELTFFEKSRYQNVLHWFLFLLIFILPVKDLRALDPGEPVYIRKGTNEGDWEPAEYVGARSDCLILERLRPFPVKAPFLGIPAQFEEERREVGEEVMEKVVDEPPPHSRMSPLVDRVLAVRQDCHEVKHAGGPFRLYVLPGNVLKTAEFNELQGSAKHFSVGDKVYAREFGLSPEHWTLRKIVAEREDCFETDSDKVLSGHYGEEQFLSDYEGKLFTIPSRIAKAIKKGDQLDGFTLKVEKSEEGAAYTTLEGVVKTRFKDTLTLKSSNDDCAYDPVRIAEIRQAPAPLSVKDFGGLKIGDVVLERVDPACCCCSPYYAARKVVSQKRGCYLLQRDKDGSGTEARFSTQMVPAEALGK